MNYKVEEYNHLAEKFRRLELDISSSLIFLPENLEEAKSKEEFIFSDSLSDIEKIFRENNVSFSQLGGYSDQYRVRKNADWWGPAIYFGASMLSENSTAVSIALNVLSNYLTDFFKGSFGDKKVKIEIYVEERQDLKFKKITYEGGVEGIKELENIIKA